MLLQAGNSMIANSPIVVLIATVDWTSTVHVLVLLLVFRNIADVVTLVEPLVFSAALELPWTVPPELTILINNLPPALAFPT